ncbi:hypothetical protein KL904_004814, partial [Ogataea polymorpha]
MYESVAQAG